MTMRFDLNNLPQDPALLQQMILDLLTQLREKDQRIEKLSHLLALLQRSRFGRKSEQVPLEQLLFAFAEAMRDGEVETNPQAEAATEAEAIKQDKPAKSSGNGHGRNPLPESLPRERVEYALPEEACKCQECGAPLERMGEEVTRQLEYVPASFIVREHVRVKYACKRCQGNVVVSAMPAQPIEKGLPGPGLLAHVLVSKYCDHLPLHRQEAIMQRYGIELSRGTMSDWVRAGAQLLRPLYDVMRREVLQGRKINTDDSPVPVQEPGTSKTRQGRLWVYVGDGEHEHTVFDFTPNRKRDGPMKFLHGYRGYLQADAYTGYDELYRSGEIVEVGCWAHARRKFYEAQDSDRERALVALAYIGRLYQVEKRGREDGLSPADLCALRRQESGPILSDLHAWLKEQAQVVLPRSPMGEAIGYALGQWRALGRYLEDGDLEIDNNAAERALRRVALGRKNWLFAGSDEGGRRAAIIYTMIASCQQHGVEPFAYLRDVLGRIPSHLQSRIEELLPGHWKPETPHVPVAAGQIDG